MRLKDFKLFAAGGRTYSKKEEKASNNPGGQTSVRAKLFADGFPIIKAIKTLDTRSYSSTEGFVIDEYVLSTYEFDSLTGHPGIKY